MPMHFLDILVIALIGLAIFGPKALQSVARNAGKGAGHAKEMKDKIMSELPMDEIARMSEHIPQVPLNSRQAVQMLITPEKPATQKPSPKSQDLSVKQDAPASDSSTLPPTVLD